LITLSPSNNDTDSPSGNLRVFVLPHAKREPTYRAQPGIGVAVALLITGNLRGPVRGVGAGLCSMLGTPMPVTAIKEHGDLCSREHDVSSSPGAQQDRCVNAKSQAEPVKGRAQRKLRSGVALGRHRLHAGSDRGAAGGRSRR